MIKFEVDTVSPSINSYYGLSGSRRFISAKGEEFKEYFQWTIKGFIGEGRITPYTDERLQVEYEFHFKGKRKRDVTNYVKSTEDAMSNLLYNDDEQVDRSIAERFYHAPENKTVVTITEYEGENDARLAQ